MKLFKKILIANRGEIAVRIMKSAQTLGIKTVAIYAQADIDSIHVDFADEAYCVGEVELSETYLNIDKIIDLAEKTGCDAIHPGYGFLSENSKFVEACDARNIVFIGPNAASMELMGNKIQARKFIESIGVPQVDAVIGDAESLFEKSKKIPFPILIKAAAGGGGKGMRIVRHEEEMKDALEATSREAKSYFGNGNIFIEKYLENPRHIEFQVLGDNFGNVVHLFERECSIQRRHQKIIEEAPSPTVDPELRKRMGEAAVRIGKETNYNSAGTIEFLVDSNKNFYFLEMNTRIQVEHPITELTTDVDLVIEQILVAAGNKLRLKQEDLKQTGHAIECRIYAEEPSNNFLPSPGKMSLYVEPQDVETRIDTGINKDTEIKSFYDPMISKLIVHAENREKAIKKMENALSEYKIHGISTNISYLKKIMTFDEYKTNKISTHFCDDHTESIIKNIENERASIPFILPIISFFIYSFKNTCNRKVTNSNVWDYIGYWRNGTSIIFEQIDRINETSKKFKILVNIQNEKGLFKFLIEDEKYNVSFKSFDYETNMLEFYLNTENLISSHVSEKSTGRGFVEIQNSIFEIVRHDILDDSLSLKDIEESSLAGSGDSVKSPMPGVVIKIVAEVGQEVKKGDVLIVVEAMKMENSLIAPRDGVIKTIIVKTGDQVDGSTSLILLEEE
ncbi:MAG: acetyl-CoA carboxylase biotin carboxylase subunit [Candidatus Cloacimonetes bacterium]|jgi:3-methylcrotonyl-CoA carboxylase alpha subunit|nr:acetyl-CoA carboxylase biotin carboxylase subunit [Candidatus Cloacimonadota bacterium]